MQGGIYQLLVYLPEATCIQIGKEGRFRFPKGYYLYTGSAKNGLQGRVRRHLRKEKRRFWHIDYLLDCAFVRGIALFADSEMDECSLSKSTLRRPGAKVIVHGFGSSDCSCPAHLAFLGRYEDGGIRRQS